MQVDLSMNRCIVFLLVPTLLLNDVWEISLKKLASDLLALISFLWHFKLALVKISVVLEIMLELWYIIKDLDTLAWEWLTSMQESGGFK